MKKDTSGSAFPVVDCGHGSPYEYGMSLRDYLAAAALQGLCASGLWGGMTHAEISEEAYSLADTMIETKDL
jgi:hypothetical protein